MLGKIVAAVKNTIVGWARSAGAAIKRLAEPTATIAAAARDAMRPRSQLVAENALLRQQLIVIRRKIKRPALSDGDRVLMVLLARLDNAWREALHLVKPETLLRWHRELFKLIWRRKSRHGGVQPRRLRNLLDPVPCTWL